MRSASIRSTAATVLGVGLEEQHVTHVDQADLLADGCLDPLELFRRGLGRHGRLQVAERLAQVGRLRSQAQTQMRQRLVQPLGLHGLQQLIDGARASKASTADWS